MVEDCQADGLFPRGYVRPWALLCWSVVHGASSLAIDGPLSGSPDVAREIVATFADTIRKKSRR